ncbi:glycoside-pentoside-hexuronide (GPH):cation symporter [Virgibacillus halophilus]|uniref:Glycoside-pentoside-hexuronide (GPH):cation symporter n=1 Tax=Tigheibacillus halophilus TaxID=361280 RepID=A0ABU5C5K3_9BACI|nr:glycoside-pentoside-hexuronide (GPH):cation symporter [Virgibacillus halophilus]
MADALKETEVQGANVTGKISTKEKIGYGIGDIASNFVWGMVSSYLLFFYTDIFGITAAAAGTLFIVTRLWDAINDPLMGIVIDKTKSKHGKTRPYLLYLPIPLAVISVLTFITPSFSEGGKLVYAYITYTLLGMAFTAINLPYASLMPRMTRDSGEKAELNSYRGMGRTIATIIVAAATLPLASLLGNGDEKIGFPITMGIYSVVATVLYFVTFKSCHERVVPKNTDKLVSLGQSVKDMMKNRSWSLVSISATLWFLRSGTMNAALIYYIKYYLGQPGMIPFYLTLLNVANLLGTVLAFFVLKKMGKQKFQCDHVCHSNRTVYCSIPAWKRFNNSILHFIFPGKYISWVR